MRRDLLTYLACPACRGRLALRVEREEAGEVLEGSLDCESCRSAYPILEGIPRLLPAICASGPGEEE